MKLFNVTYEEDGRTIKGDGVTETEVRKVNLYYVAETFDDVYDAIAWVRNDPEKDFKGITEVLTMVTVIPGAQP